MTGKHIKLHAEIVNGKCPTCHELTILVGLTPEFFRCISCGADLQQHVNGKISYLPSLTPTSPMSTIEKLFGYGET
jgi:ribosomal protein S27E|tara:strand:+ start:181 stop:408 length:228 start_codon:yes stop_codon:yes gene_type:complete